MLSLLAIAWWFAAPLEAASMPASRQAEAASASTEPRRDSVTPLPRSLRIDEPVRVGWDLSLEVGLGVGLPNPRVLPMGRARAGVLVYRYPWYVMAGATYEISPLSLASVGLQGELIHLGSGLWAQLGGSLSIAARPGVMAALGWSLFGVEAQWRDQTGAAPDWLLLAKLRVPIELVVMAIEAERARP